MLRAFGEVSGFILIGIGTCGAGAFGNYAKGAAKAYEIASGASDAARAGADMYTNGVSISNAFQMAAGGAGAISAGITSCFTAGTQIVVGAEYDENDVFVQYVTTNIEDIKVGDLVYSYDTLTGEVSQQQVLSTSILESDHIDYLTVIDENGYEQTIETTDAHPFWVVTNEPDLDRAARDVADGMYHENLGQSVNGFWVEAKDLKEGDVFLDANGEFVTLVAVERAEFPEGITVFNIEIEGNHNYFVIAQSDGLGQICVLVHNGCPIKVTKNGVAILEDANHTIPKNYVSNPYRPGSYGTIDKGKFAEKLRIDPPTPTGMKGPEFSHYHLDGGKEHFAPRPGTTDPGF